MPADLRSQTSQIVIVIALVISRWTVSHTPLTLVTPSGLPFAADVSINTIDSVYLSCAHVGLYPTVRGRSLNADSLLLTLHDWSLSLDPNTL